MLAACHEQGLTPLVTLHHFSNPRWLMKRVGWESPQTPERFAAYCRAVMQELGSLIPFVCTLNEANIASVLRLLGIGEASDDAVTKGAANTQGIQAPIGMVSERSTQEGGTSWLEAAAREMNTTADRLKTFVLSTSEKALEVKLAAHRRAVETVKSTSPDAQVGITLAVHDIQAVPSGSKSSLSTAI
jgi:beta-glucosidase